MTSPAAVSEVLAGTRRWTVQEGDCLQVLRQMPDACIDAIVTDPPYFLTNASGSGFMGKQWDSLSPDNAVVVAFFKSMRLVCGTDVVSTAHPLVNTDAVVSGAPPFKEAVSFAEPASKATPKRGASAHGLVITRAEGLALCAELSPDLTDFLQRLPTNALLVEPPSFLEPDGSDTALRVAAILLGVPAWQEKITSSIKTDSGPRESQAIAEKSGHGFVAPSTSATDGTVADAAFTAREETSNATTLCPGDYRATIQRITSLPCVKDATRRFIKTPNRMGIVSEWWHGRWVAAAYRVLKPGGYVLAFGGTRTVHRLTSALEGAGFEIRDVLQWIHGQGFPKSLNIGKAIDKLAGAERDVIGSRLNHYPDTPSGYSSVSEKGGSRLGGMFGPSKGEVLAAGRPVTAPATDDAKQWEGWGTALKPSCEPIILCRKPFNGSLARNVLEHGTGALNIDGCRVPHASAADLAQHTTGVDAIKARGGVMDNSWKNSSDLSGASDVSAAGRWPSHLLLSHASGCERVGDKKVKAAPPWNDNRPPSLFTGKETSPVHHSDGDGTETVADWECVEGCPVKLLDEQSGECASGGRSGLGGKLGTGYGGRGRPVEISNAVDASEGGASRYFTTFPAGAPVAHAAGCRRVDPEADYEWRCVDGCPVKLLDEQSGENGSSDRPASHGRAYEKTSYSGYGVAEYRGGHNDEGGASRYFTTFPPFFYTAKADRSDREKGCEHLPIKSGGELTGRTDGTDGLNSPRAGTGRGGGRRNTHPTVKSTDLMRWLVRLITPPGGVVLDMFCGSGSTGVGCSAEGFRFIGIELDPHSVEIAKARITGDLPLFNTDRAGGAR